jgi:hypothetical protein
VSDVQFFQTRMGQQFYDGTMPRIAAALDKIAKALAAKEQEPKVAALVAIQTLMNGQEWDADTLDAIAEELRAAGYPVMDIEPESGEK